MARKSAQKGGLEASGPYRVPSHCVICGKDYLARYNLGSRAKVCTPKTHVCRAEKRETLGGRNISVRCVENCCRSQYAKGAADQFKAGILERHKLFAEQGELDRVWRKLGKIPPVPRLALRLVLAGALRVGEALLLRPQDCVTNGDLPHIFARTLKRKGRPIKRFDLDEGLAKDLQAHLRAHKGKPDEPIFTMAKRTLQLWWTRLQRLAGQELFRGMHSLRHTRLTRASEEGADPKYLMELGGWASMDMVGVYTHVTDKIRRRMIGKLPKV